MENRPFALESVERAMANAASLAHAEMKRGIASLASIASTAPLFGFLGTVVGIFTSFQGTTGPKTAIMAAILAALSEALVPTVLGLCVALLALGFYRYLSAKLEDLKIEMRSASFELINQLSRLAESTKI